MTTSSRDKPTAAYEVKAVRKLLANDNRCLHERRLIKVDTTTLDTTQGNLTHLGRCRGDFVKKRKEKKAMRYHGEARSQQETPFFITFSARRKGLENHSEW